MKQFIKKNVIKYLSSMGISVDKVTDKASLMSLIERLHPFRTDRNLIRLGADGDGGYLVPDDLEGISACFSPGVGNLSAFEEDCLKYGMQIFLADNSVDGPLPNNDGFNFIKKFIGPVTTEENITMDDWVDNSLADKNSDLLLQMDIEGDEYFSIINMSESLIKRCRIIVIEFHQLQKLYNKEFFNIALIVFQKLLLNHVCVHIHPNNCCEIERLWGIEIPKIAEFSFIRKDRINSKTLQTFFPHPLDVDSTSKETITLPKSWY